jgi:hypothetical protein
MVNGVAMSQIVRRVPQSLVESSESDNLQPSRIHRATGILVESQLSLGIEPKLLLAWNILPEYWNEGFTLMVFRNNSGFCPDKHPENLNSHGELFIETRQNDRYEERPAEGTFYYTFVLHRKFFLGLAQKISIVRFSETIPSAKVGLGRIKDQIDLQEMLQRHELGKVDHAANMNEAEIRRLHSQRQLDVARDPPAVTTKNVSLGNSVVAEELNTVDAMIEACLAKRKKINDLEQDPRFAQLPIQERRRILRQIRERLDAGEISARQERRKR